MTPESSAFPRGRSETGWICFIRDLWGPPGGGMAVGDDCAVLPPGRYAVSTDALAEGIDFELDWAPPEALGHKALAANLSDLAACGARPAYFFLTLGVPRGLPDLFVEGLLSGMKRLSDAEAVRLAGGDLTASRSGLFLSLTVVGAQEFSPVLRSGGRPGDALFVGGPLGGARAGLALLQGGHRLGPFETGPAPFPEGFARRFFAPPSQSELGLFLSSRRLATAALDLSDGLAKDLGRLCEASGCGALLDLPSLPLEEGLTENPPAGETPIQCALRGGEDQVLLFSVPPSRELELAEAPCPVYRVGHLAGARDGLTARAAGGTLTRLEANGHDHFAP